MRALTLSSHRCKVSRPASCRRAPGRARGRGARGQRARDREREESAQSKVDKRVRRPDAFLKKRTRWDDDHEIQPVDQGQSSGVRDKFSHDILGRDIASVRRYWAQLVFSGRGVPPPELSSDADVVKYVAAHGDAIGYVSGAIDLAGVKAVEIE